MKSRYPETSEYLSGQQKILTSIIRSYPVEELIVEELFSELPFETDPSLYASGTIPPNGESDKALILPENALLAAETPELRPTAFQEEDLTISVKLKPFASTATEADLKQRLKILSGHAKSLKKLVLQKRERQAAHLVQHPGFFDPDNTLTITSDANRFDSDSSDPIGVIRDCSRIVSAKIGKDPNTLTLSAESFGALVNHIQLKPDSGEDAVEALQEAFGIERILIGSVLEANEAGSPRNVWNNNILLSYQSGSDAETGLGFCGTNRDPAFPYLNVVWLDVESGDLALTYRDHFKLSINNRDAGFLIIDPIQEADCQALMPNPFLERATI